MTIYIRSLHASVACLFATEVLSYLLVDPGESHLKDIHSKALSLGYGSSNPLISLDFCVLALIGCLLHSKIVPRTCPSVASLQLKPCHQSLPVTITIIFLL